MPNYTVTFRVTGESSVEVWAPTASQAIAVAKDQTENMPWMEIPRCVDLVEIKEFEEINKS
jgi:hypothetical protein